MFLCLLLGALIPFRVWRRKQKDTAVLRGLEGGPGRETGERKDREDLIFNVTRGVSATTGESFFQELGRYLARATGCCFALIAANHEQEGAPGLCTLAVCLDGRPCPNFHYNPIGTPCEPVLSGQCCICPKDAWKVYTICDQVRAHLLMESYVGTPLLDSAGQVMGLLAVCHRAPLKDGSEAASLLRIFSARAAAELERRRAERHQLELEKQVLHAQKLESLGLLAGGIAHDFNNLLAALLGNLNLAQVLLPPDAPAQAHLEAAEKIIVRATDLTGQMLAYSGKGRFVVRPLDLNHLLKEMTHLLGVSIAKKISIDFDLTAPLPAIVADQAQLQQVILNLVTNAADAIGDQVGNILIKTEAEDVDRHALEQGFPGQGLQPGSFVALSVKDTGCGMGPEVLSRIFDPFFTTKEKGRGLGLSATLGILRGHQAGMTVRSAMGVGTTFRLVFPAVEACPEEPGKADGAPAVLPKARVLIVDDEAIIRDTTKGMLNNLGLSVAVAVDGWDAVEKVRQDPAIDLVILDLTMPKMDGREAFHLIRHFHPGLPVILSSGFHEQDSIQGLLECGLAGFLQKPYTLQSLKAKIGEVLVGLAGPPGRLFRPS